MNYSKIPSPAFVLDEKQLRKNLALIKKVQDEADIEIILALKGFAMWRVFPIIKEYIEGATASSLKEARLIYEEMKTKAHVYSPAYTDEEFERLLPISSHIVFNSLSQFEKLKGKTGNTHGKVSFGLRVNPEKSDVETELYNPSAPRCRLGVLHEYLSETLPEEIEGLHFHVLCESNSYTLEKVMLAFEERFGSYLSRLKWLNIGGGHLLTHKNYNVEHLIKVLKAFSAKHNIQIIMEPGSAFAWEAGVLVSEVLDVVENRGLKTAILNVSFTAHMPDTMEMPYRPQIVGAKEPTKDSKYLYRLGGCSCLAGDFMEVYAFEHKLKIGDRVIFKDMMHYTMVKTTMFNGVQHPEIGLWLKNNTYQTIRKFDYNDYKSRLS